MNTNWRESPDYINFLRYFRTPKDRNDRSYVYQYITRDFKENPDNIFQTLIDERLLVPPSLSDAIVSLYTKAPVEEKLKELGLSTSGSKLQIIQRLIDNDQSSAEKMIQDREMLVCSAAAFAFLEEFDSKKADAENRAKQASFIALVAGDDREAHHIVVEYQRRFQPNSEGPNIRGERVKYRLKSEPTILSQLNSENKYLLRAACFMPLLWYGEKPVRWLPDTFKSQYEDNEVLANLFTRYAEIMESIDWYDEKTKIEISFDRYDVDSCSLCRKLDGKMLLKKEIPELPYLNCTSRKGCQCQLRMQLSRFDFDDASDESEDNFSGAGVIIELPDILDSDNLDEAIAERVDQFIRDNVEVKLDPVSKLKQLKQMLEEDLITEEEYQEAKHRILSQL